MLRTTDLADRYQRRYGDRAPLSRLAMDRKPNAEGTRNLRRARRLEGSYGRRLRAIAAQIGLLTESYDPERSVSTSDAIIAALGTYADMLTPWAESAGARMLADVAHDDEIIWARRGREMGRALRQEINRAPTGALMQSLLAEQVTYIKSLPLEAAQRVHEWTLRGIQSAERPEKVAEEIYATGHVTRSRATLIARAEVARTA